MLSLVLPKPTLLITYARSKRTIVKCVVQFFSTGVNKICSQLKEMPHTPIFIAVRPCEPVNILSMVDIIIHATTKYASLLLLIIMPVISMNDI